VTEFRTVVTLRARFLDGTPEVGAFMAAGQANRPMFYRIVQVVRLTRVGSPAQSRFRLICARVTAAELPDGAVVHAWRWDRLTPPPRPATAEPSPESRPAPMKAVPSAARSRRLVKRTVSSARHNRDWSGVDFGPSLRRRPVRDHKGKIIRTPDVELTEGPDPASPNRRIRRAVRADPLTALLRAGSITGDEVEAAEILRAHLERLSPTMVGAPEAVGHVNWFNRHAITEIQIKAAGFVRRAAANLGELWWPVLWVCYGGTVTGMAAKRHVREATARAAVQDGLKALADHVEGRRRPVSSHAA
jgi:hypothetical protein